MGSLIYCWHGTNKKNADSILKNGFKKKTYFAAHLEDAIAFGGKHVFMVEFDIDKFNGEPKWQFTTNEHIPIEKIHNYKILTIKTVLLNR